MTVHDDARTAIELLRDALSKLTFRAADHQEPQPLEPLARRCLIEIHEMVDRHERLPDYHNEGGRDE